MAKDTAKEMADRKFANDVKRADEMARKIAAEKAQDAKDKGK